MSVAVFLLSCQNIGILEQLQEHKRKVELGSSFNVVSTDPANGATGVSINTNISVTLNRSVNTTTVDANITVRTGGCTGGIVSTGFTGSSEDNRTILIGIPALTHSTSYSICVEGGLASTEAETLGDRRVEAVFTTAAAGVPTIVSFTTATTAGFYGVGTTIPITMNLSENVTVTGSPALSLTTGLNAAYSSGSGTSSLAFSYTVANGENGVLNVQSINLGLATITSSASGQNLSLTLPAGSNLQDNVSLTIDTTAPTATGLALTVGTLTPALNDPLTIQVNFSENVTGTGTIQLNDNFCPIVLPCTNPNNETQMVCSGPAQGGPCTTDTWSIDLSSGGTIVDSANNVIATPIPGALNITLPSP